MEKASPLITESKLAAQALLGSQFYANVKPAGEELPPIFDSSTFTESVARDLAKVAKNHTARWVTYRSRRFDGLVRQMGLFHPVPYARLILHLQDNWSAISPLTDGKQSMVRPRVAPGSDRVITMDYPVGNLKAHAETRAAQGKRYLVVADISNCFSSIYSHAIDWAIRGFNDAKTVRGKSTWAEMLDARVMGCHDGETKGLAIGPAVSNVISEIVLQRVDARLRDRLEVEFVRYIDDYSAYFDERGQAEQFIAELDASLAAYRLTLNARKTRIVPLRQGFGDAWISDIHASFPRNRRTIDAIRYIQHCERLAIRNPGASVLTYALKALLGRRGCPRLGQPALRPPKRARDLPILDEMIRVNYFHPHLSHILVRFLAYVSSSLTRNDRARIAVSLRSQLEDSCRRRETDTATWLIYGIRRVLKERIPLRKVKDLISLEIDDLTLLAFAATSRKSRAAVVASVRQMTPNEVGDRQEHWLIRYELFRVRALGIRDLHATEKQWFEIAKKRGLAFSDMTP